MTWQLPAIRRSPLELDHARLGARWTSPETLWPIDYGDGPRELQAAIANAGLAEIGPVAKVEVRGIAAGRLIEDAGGSMRTGAVAGRTDKGEREVWGVAPDHALVMYAKPEELMRAAPAGPGRPGVAVIDVSSAFTLLRLVGPNARLVLAELCPLDLDPAVFTDRRLALTPVANVRVALARFDWRGVPSYTIAVARDYARYLWNALVQAGRPHGLGAVGAGSIGEVPPR
jgi:heterotetrameric sarcosine oxidase gamma subunit